MTPAESPAAVELLGVAKKFGAVVALGDISLAVRDGEFVCFLGPSGCGKTTTGRCVLRLIEPTEGSVRFEGREITKLPYREMRHLRRHMQIIFQDPYASLNPRMTVGQILAEPIQVHGINGASCDARVKELLDVAAAPR